MEIKKSFLTMKAVKHWSRSPREDVEFPSPKCVKCRLDEQYIGMMLP